MPEIALRLEDVSHVFHRDTPNEVRALDAVDLTLERGTFTVVLGTNGSGKSSLLNAIAGSLAADQRPGLPGGRGADPLAGAAPGAPDQPRVPESVHRHGLRPERRGEPRARGRARRPAVASPRARPRAPARRCGSRWPGWAWAWRTASIRPSACCPAGSVRRSRCSWRRWCGRRCCCSTSTPRRSIRGARSWSSGSPRRAVARGELTTLMVTHSLGQAVRLGDRVLVMHRGRVVHDLGDVRRRRLTEADLLQLFDQLRWADRLDDVGGGDAAPRLPLDRGTPTPPR